ncbi:ABC transporter permease [Marinivivus vitaminiproducens]|uniref:ABC transporter permease n=1 Tax=Marinivivus vitaminiproducens TaxID=3035935 RepID=UPI0027A3E1BA|nr:ABC transporter permease [Geminicoccaceae bacterium SCSIO 64248]
MRLEPRPHVPPGLRIGAPVAAALVAFGLSAVPIAATGAPVLEAYALLLQGAFGSTFALAETLTRATPLILTGLAVAIAFRANLWNIGAEGQLYAGALAAVMIGGGALSLPAPLLLPAVLVAGAAAGALLLLVPTLLKLRFGVDEVVTTLLLNFVVLLFVQMMLEGPLQDPMGMGWPQSAPVIGAAELPRLIPRTRVHAGLLLALVLAVAAWLYAERTTWGLQARAVGTGVAAARYAGMNVTAILLRTALISGGLAGLAGVSEIAGLRGYLTQDLSPGFGYSGIVVAMLAQLNPLGCVLSALFIAGVFVGADSMSRALGVSSYLANLIVATSLLTMLLAGLFTRYRLRRG